jgi:hypothetical protein
MDDYELTDEERGAIEKSREWARQEGLRRAKYNKET